MAGLPPEILSEYILPYVNQSYVRQTIPAYSEISKVVSSLQKHPAGTWDVLCDDAVFRTRIEFGRLSYLTGLSKEELSDSKAIKLSDEKPRYIVVWLDKIGILEVKFVSSATIQDLVEFEYTWVYAFAFTEKIQVRSKVGKSWLQMYKP